jgi:hypothetical protein
VKAKIFSIVLVIIIGIAAVFFLKIKKQKTEVVDKDAILVIEGKIEDLRKSNIPQDPTKCLIMISNSGELVILRGGTHLNTIRFGGFVGKEVKLKGYWHEPLPFRGRKYRSFQITKIIR